MLDQEKKWYYQPWVVILLLFFVLGPLGLPFVYKSPKFNKFWKIILTIAMVFYTIYLIEATIKVAGEVMKEVAQLQATLK